MKVIVAGYPKTGTKSMYAALKRLGYNVYDFMENATFLNEEWGKIFSEGWTTEDFRKMYENVDAITDVPAYYFWEEIHKAFPDAKIILTMRDDEEAWYKSMEKQLRGQESSVLLSLMRIFSPTARKMLANVGRYVAPIELGLDHMPYWNPLGQMTINKEMLMLKYRSHNAYVLQNAPSDKLLVFKCSQGWEPLCEILGIPVPNEEFPHRNKGAEIIEELIDTNPDIQKMKREMAFSLLTLTVLSGIGLYFMISHGPRSLLNHFLDVCHDFSKLLKIT